LKQSHRASKTKRIPPRAAPITIPIDTLFELALAAVFIGAKEILEFILAVTNDFSWGRNYMTQILRML
jgi:hypothetical protein